MLDKEGLKFIYLSILEKNKEKKPNGKENRLFEDSDDFFDENLR